MAFITCTFSSSVLQKSTQFNAIIPQGKEIGAPVLYLLHGLTDDYTAWARYTSIERYANEAGIVVIMPDGARSFYTDMAYGNAYYSFFTKEFFNYIPTLFPVSKKREDTFIAGLSMGGYGALKFALRNPDKFSAAASLSGAVDVSSRLLHDPRWSEIQRDVFGVNNTVAGTQDDLFYLVKHYTYPQTVRLYLTCGEEDFLYQNNLRFSEAVSKSPLPYYFRSAHGVHDWKFWDMQIQEAIRFFLNRNIVSNS